MRWQPSSSFANKPLPPTKHTPEGCLLSRLRSAVALESDVAMMDEQHNTCCEHLAKGNVEDFGEELLGSVVGIWGNAFSMKCGC